MLLVGGEEGAAEAAAQAAQRGSGVEGCLGVLSLAELEAPEGAEELASALAEWREGCEGAGAETMPADLLVQLVAAHTVLLEEQAQAQAQAEAESRAEAEAQAAAEEGADAQAGGEVEAEAEAVAAEDNEGGDAVEGEAAFDEPTPGFLYLVDGLGTGADAGDRTIELVEAGLPLVAVVWAHKLIEVPDPEAEAEGDEAAENGAPTEPLGRVALESIRALGAWDDVLSRIAAVEHTISGAEAAGEGAEAEGCAMLEHTVKAVLAARTAYSAWEQGATVFDVPTAGACDLQLFRKLLEGVSPSLQTIPVFVHCLVEQVVRSSESNELTSLPEESPEARKSSILEILDGAFSSVTLEDAGNVAERESDDVKVTYEATGKPVVSTGGSKFLDVDAAEKAIAQLETPDAVGTGRRGMPDVPTLPASIKGTQQTLLASLCGDVGLDSVNRYHLLDFARQALPAEVEKVHGVEVVSRRHVEALEPAVLSERLKRAKDDYLDRQAKYYPEEDAVVVACYAGTEQHQFDQAFPAAHSLSTYTTACLQDGGKAPELPSRLYGLSSGVGATESNRYFYLSNGSAARVDTKGGVHVRQKGNTFTLGPDGSLRGELSDGSFLSVKARSEDDAESQMSSMAFVIPEGMRVEFSSNGSVSALPCKTLRDGEVSRCVIPGGTVLKHDAGGGGPFIMFADGSTMHKADGQLSEPDGAPIASWFGVTKAGRRWERPVKFPEVPQEEPEESPQDDAETPVANDEEVAAAEEVGDDSGEAPVEPASAEDECAGEAPEDVPLPEPIALDTVSAATVVDPDTRAKVTTRVDMVMIVDYEDGATIVTHADGTRVVSDDRQGTWKVESEGYLPIQGSEGKIQVGAASWEKDTGMSYALPEQGVLSFSGDEVHYGQIKFSLKKRAVEWLDADGELELTLCCAKDDDSRGLQGDAAGEESAEGEGDAGSETEDTGAEQESAGAEDAEEGAEQEGSAGVDTEPANEDTEDSSAEAKADSEDMAEVEEEVTFACVSQRPRIFIVYEDGHGYEYLSAEDFSEYAQMKGEDPNCSVSSEEVIGSGEKSMSHFFLTHQESRYLGVKALPVAPPVNVQQSLPPFSLKTLQLPSTVHPPLPSQNSTGLTMPRIAAPQVLGEKYGLRGSKKNVAMRQILECPAFEDAKKIEEILEDFRQIQDKQASTTPQSYKIEDVRSDQARADEAEVANMIATLRREKLSSLNAADGKQRGGAECSGEAAFTKEKKPYPTEVDPYLGTPKRPSEGLTLNYFDCEEGIVALKSGLPVVTSEQPQASNDLASAARTSKAEETESAALPAATGDLDSAALFNFFMSGKAALGGNVNSEEIRACDLENLIRGNLGFVELVKQNGRGAELDSLVLDLGTDPEQSIHVSHFTASILGSPFEVSALEQASSKSEGGDENHEVYGDGVAVGGNPEDSLQDSWDHSFETNNQSLGYSTGRSTALNIYGKPRPPPSNIPKVHRMETAASEPNHRYIEVEAGARRHVKLSSTRNLGGATGYKRQFTLSPASIHFSSVKVGQSRTKTALLTNVSPELGRFKVKRPEAPFSVTYTPGFVVAGMKQKLHITFSATEEGEFQDEILIETEFNIFYLPVSGQVISPSTLSQEPSLAGSFAAPATEETPSEPVPPKFNDRIDLDENKKLSEIVQK